ncbi:hypothetical protein N0V83_002395 [Neocucurbitaria cava]|uniref:AB hydrolase-1 domain-containing protein n=1 Tax=Neocucurbitaria cava TaxID=798079 RepID=A0A9W9CQX1_9PLEO|nr:hypothetical protein N0V83_002395 [Neocucurbitaria cava]
MAQLNIKEPKYFKQERYFHTPLEEMDHNTYQEDDGGKLIDDSLEMYNLPMQTINLDILEGTTVSYHQTPCPPNPSRPTLLMIPDLATTPEIFRHQLTNHTLSNSMNLIAVEPLGHGKTRTQRSDWTNRDSAAVCLATLDALHITGGNLFVAGLGHGGYLAVLLALLAPSRVAGLIPMGTSLFSSTTATNPPHSRNLQGSSSRDAHATALTPYIDDEWAHPSIFRLFEPSSSFIHAHIITRGFGSAVSQRDRDFWSVTVRQNWSGESGRQRARRACINLRDREDLCGRLGEVKCPVLWLHGEKDEVCSVEVAREEVGLFGSAEKRFEVVGGERVS